MTTMNTSDETEYALPFVIIDGDVCLPPDTRVGPECHWCRQPATAHQIYVGDDLYCAEPCFREAFTPHETSA